MGILSALWSFVSGLLGLKTVISDEIKHEQAEQQGATLQANVDLAAKVQDDQKQIDALKQDAVLVDKLGTDNDYAERLRTSLNKRSSD